MTLAIEKVWIRILFWFTWRNNGKLVQERIRHFEATEDDSAWHMLHAATQVENPIQKAQLFMQSLEESHHAEIFRDLYKTSSGEKLRKIPVARVPLFKKGEEWKLFAFCSIGEAAAAKQFKLISENLAPGAFRSALEKILEEEEGHIDLAQSLIQQTGHPKSEVDRELRKIHFKRAWQSWMRTGRKVSAALAYGLLFATYDICAFCYHAFGGSRK